LDSYQTCECERRFVTLFTSRLSSAK
jgi:hypothetical protein